MSCKVENYLNSVSEEDFKEEFGEEMDKDTFLDFYNVLDQDEQQKLLSKAFDN